MIFGTPFSERKPDSRLDWHPFFALLPVPLPDGRTAWLRWVERKLTPLPSWEMPFEAEYRLPEAA
jgi:hypothetical protein